MKKIKNGILFLLRKYDYLSFKAKRRVSFVWIILSPLRYIRDRFWLPLIFKRTLESDLGTMKRDIGFLEIYPESRLVLDIIENTRNLVKERKQFNTKPYLQEISDLSDYGPSSPEFQLATSPNLVGTVTRYLGSFPYLHNITALWSPSPEKIGRLSEQDYSGSQLFHRDGDDIRVAKVWILCESVTHENGPTVLLTTSKSDEICKEIKYKEGERISIEVEKSLNIKQTDLRYAIGNQGTTYMTDTVRLLHYGSRTQKNSERLVLMFHYVTFFSNYVRPIVRDGKGEKLHGDFLEEVSPQLSRLQTSLIRFHLR